MRSVTTGWVCTRRGIDVLPLNPCDPLKRPANYPRIWMKLSFLGLGPGSTVPLGLLNAAIFLIAAIGVFDPKGGVGGAALYAAALCSPAVMLGIERGNVDLLLFAMVALAAVVARRERFGPILAGALVLFAAVLKLLIFSLGLLARQRRRVLSSGRWSRSSQRTRSPPSATFAPSARSCRRRTPTRTGSTSPDGGSRARRRRSRRRRRSHRSCVGRGPPRRNEAPTVARLPALDCARPPRPRRLLGRGGGVRRHVCLFHSFDYRLVFLLLTIPQLLRWARRAEPSRGCRSRHC